MPSDPSLPTQSSGDHLKYEIVLEPKSYAPFDAEPFKVVVKASGLDTARTRAYGLLKRTYGDGTRQGNPMWWDVTGQRGFVSTDAVARADDHQATGRDRCGACGRFLAADSYYSNRCSDCWGPEDEFLW